MKKQPKMKKAIDLGFEEPMEFTRGKKGKNGKRKGGFKKMMEC